MDIAKDLSREAPRSPRVRLHDYVILCRTIDKCRALLHGNIGPYHFDCPLDNMLFGFKKISGEDFKARVQASANDEDIAFWLDQASEPKTPGEAREWSAKTEAYKPYDDPEKKEWFVGECEPLGLDPQKATLFDYLEADDANYGKAQ